MAHAREALPAPLPYPQLVMRTNVPVRTLGGCGGAVHDPD